MTRLGKRTLLAAAAGAAAASASVAAAHKHRLSLRSEGGFPPRKDRKSSSIGMPRITAQLLTAMNTDAGTHDIGATGSADFGSLESSKDWVKIREESSPRDSESASPKSVEENESNVNNSAPTVPKYTPREGSPDLQEVVNSHVDELFKDGLSSPKTHLDSVTEEDDIDYSSADDAPRHFAEPAQKQQAVRRLRVSFSDEPDPFASERREKALRLRVRRVRMLAAAAAVGIFAYSMRNTCIRDWANNVWSSNPSPKQQQQLPQSPAPAPGPGNGNLLKYRSNLLATSPAAAASPEAPDGPEDTFNRVAEAFRGHYRAGRMWMKENVPVVGTNLPDFDTAKAAAKEGAHVAYEAGQEIKEHLKDIDVEEIAEQVHKLGLGEVFGEAMEKKDPSIFLDALKVKAGQVYEMAKAAVGEMDPEDIQETAEEVADVGIELATHEREAKIEILEASNVVLEGVKAIRDHDPDAPKPLEIAEGYVEKRSHAWWVRWSGRAEAVGDLWGIFFGDDEEKPAGGADAGKASSDAAAVVATAGAAAAAASSGSGADAAAGSVATVGAPAVQVVSVVPATSSQPGFISRTGSAMLKSVTHVMLPRAVANAIMIRCTQHNAKVADDKYFGGELQLPEPSAFSSADSKDFTFQRLVGYLPKGGYALESEGKFLADGYGLAFPTMESFEPDYFIKTRQGQTRGKPMPGLAALGVYTLVHLPGMVLWDPIGVVATAAALEAQPRYWPELPKALEGASLAAVDGLMTVAGSFWDSVGRRTGLP